jgi:hypothetical protein
VVANRQNDLLLNNFVLVFLLVIIVPEREREEEKNAQKKKKKINGRRLVGTTLLKRYHVLVADGYSIYDKACLKTSLHVLMLSGKTVQIDHRHTDR